MRRGLFCFLIILVIIIASCTTTTQTVTEEEVLETNTTVTETFDPARVSQQQYVSTMEEVQVFIEQLNRIIASKNYQGWRATLSPEYFAEISSPQALKEASEQPAMKTRRIVLRTAEDYFIHVVVPSRANSRVDAIEFIGRDRVKAFTVTTNRAGEEVRLRLYDLEKINNSWIIIN